MVESPTASGATPGTTWRAGSPICTPPQSAHAVPLPANTTTASSAIKDAVT